MIENRTTGQVGPLTGGAGAALTEPLPGRSPEVGVAPSPLAAQHCTPARVNNEGRLPSAVAATPALLDQPSGDPTVSHDEPLAQPVVGHPEQSTVQQIEDKKKKWFGRINKDITSNKVCNNVKHLMVGALAVGAGIAIVAGLASGVGAPVVVVGVIAGAFGTSVWAATVGGFEYIPKIQEDELEVIEKADECEVHEREEDEITVNTAHRPLIDADELEVHESDDELEVRERRLHAAELYENDQASVSHSSSPKHTQHLSLIHI